MILLACGVLIVIVVTISASLIIKDKRPLRHIWAEAKYEVMYNILGGKALIEDIVMRKQNKANLINKSGKVCLITGGTRGIGVEVIRMLLQCDMTVIMGCRKIEAGQKLLHELREKGLTNGILYIHQLDTSSLKSVKNFAEIIRKKYTSINILINNAGIMYVPYSESEDGFESQFATNYLGHFLLTHLLLPLLKNGGKAEENARIVNVSSCAYLTGEIDFEDINKKKMFISFEAYSQSKLAQVLFSNYLNKMFIKNGDPVQVYSVHPGLVNTDIFDDTIIKNLCWWILPYIFKNATQGAMSIVYASIEPKLEGKGGNYISNCKIQEQTKLATNENLQDRLFEFSKKLVNIESF